MDEEVKECIKCGRPFVTHIKRKVYCNIKCQKAAKNKRDRKKRKKVLEVKHTPTVVLDKVDLSFYY